MKTIRKNLAKVFIILQLLLIAYLWCLLLYSLVSGTPIFEILLNWQWWLVFFGLDMYSTKFFRELPKSSE